MSDETTPGREITIEWTDEDRAKVRRLTEEPKRRLELFNQATAGLDAVLSRLGSQRDELTDVVSRLSSAEPGELSPDDVTLLVDAASGWLLKFGTDDMAETVSRDRVFSGDGFPASQRTVFIGRGEIW